MPARPAVHVMCGLVGVGKTTIARQLAEELPAVRLTRDEWMLRLVGGRFDDEAYVAALQPCTDLLWSVADDVLRVGGSVVLDWNHWSRARRQEALRKARVLGVELIVHFVDSPIDVAIARATTRIDGTSHALTADDVNHMATLLEPPDVTEGFTVVVH